MAFFQYTHVTEKARVAVNNFVTRTMTRHDAVVKRAIDYQLTKKRVSQVSMFDILIALG